ncbi:LysM peptidoglycan-binding domain-containing protein [Actinomadura sp.]|uniref:LysM peptidoglycan-binding domain-containing protein n=1 Tax=Actinomadura sp. TaxID=1989 RepID=UPI0037C69180
MQLAIEQQIKIVESQNEGGTSALDTELLKFFKDETPRFYVAAGAAFGHQASTVLLLKKFVARKLVTKAELVYPNKEILEKLRTLLPEIQPGESGFRLTVSGGTAEITLVEKTGEPPGKVTKLAITGGFDHTSGEVEKLAGELNADMLLVLQPYGWEEEGGKPGASVAYFPKAPDRPLVDLSEKITHLAARLYGRPEIALTEKQWTELAALPGKEQVVEAAKAVLDGVRDGRLFCPVYGISNVGEGSAKNGLAPGGILFNLAGTARVLQEGSQDKFRKGTVILVLANIKDASWKLLESWVAGKNLGSSPASVRLFAEKYLCPGGDCKVLVERQLNDAGGIAKKIAALKDDEVLILNLQSLPQAVFDLLYAEATLPSVFEGAGTAGLVIPLGKPYFRLADVPYPVLPFNALMDSSALSSKFAAGVLRQEHRLWNEQEGLVPPHHLAHYIGEAYEDGSPLQKYFQRFKTFMADQPQEEKLQAALQWVFTSEAYKKTDFTLVGAPIKTGDAVLAQVYKDLKENLGADGKLAVAPGAFKDGPLARLYEAMAGGSALVLTDANVAEPADGKVVARGRGAGVLGLPDSDVDLVFTDGDAGLTGAIQVRPAAAGSWSLTGAPWFLIRDSFLKIVRSDDPAGAVTGFAGGAVPLPGGAAGASAGEAEAGGGSAMSVVLSVPPAAGRWTFDASFTAPGPSLARVFGLLGGVNLAQALPAPLNAAADLAVRRFQIGYLADTREIASFSVRFATTASWPLVGNIVLNGLELLADVADPAGPRRRNRFEIIGTFALGQGAVRVTAQLPEQIFLGTLVPPADPAVHVQIADVVGLFLPSGQSVPVNGAVTLFDFQYNRPAGTWSVDCGVLADWPVPAGSAEPWFTIENLAFAARGNATGVEGRFGGTVLILPDSAKIQLAVEASYAKETGWRFEGRQTGGAVPLGELLAAYTGWRTEAKYGISDLELSIATGDGSWAFGGATAEPWVVPFLPHASLTGRLRLGSGAAGRFARLESEVRWEDLRLRVWWDYNPQVNAFGITWNGLEGKVAGPEKDTGDYTAELGLAAGATLGSVIETMVSWITGTGFALAPPWNVLNSVKPGDLALTYRFNPKDTSRNQVGFKVGIGPIDLGFARIDGISVVYQSTGPDRGVMVTLDGFFPWNVGDGALGDMGSLGPWDTSRPGSAPTPPGQGGKYIDLRLLALGQHIDVPGLDQATTVGKAIEAMKKLPPAEPDGIPDVRLDRSVSWVAGLDIGILRFEGAAGGLAETGGPAVPDAAKPAGYLLDGQVVFCDPRLYGLRVALDGPAAKVFKGLALEVMYRQISDAVGVYQAEITLPDQMRHLNVGAYAITLPVFAVAVYTNGDFLVDVGFPRNMDFSRSFTLEAVIYPGIPLLGSGGFYLGKLSSATTDLVPKASNGTFNPVIVFGFGLQAGFGKSVQYGILKAGFSLTVAGVLEGVLGKWNPYEPGSALERAGSGALDQVQGGYYFLVRGTVGLLGRLYGSVDFSVVKADVDVRIAALAEIAYESFVSLSLSLVLSVDVSASIKIDAGLFTIKITFKFSMRLKETFTIDNLGTPPWRTVDRGPSRALGASAGVLGGPADRRLRMRRELAAGLAARAARPPEWGNLRPPAEPAELTGYAAPGLALARDEWADPRDAGAVEQFPCWVAMLLIDSVPPVHEAMLAGPADGAAGDTSFETLCKGVLRWVVAAIQDGPRTAEEIDALVVDELELAYLLDEVLVSSDAVPAPVPADAVERFLGGAFRLTVRGPADAPPEGGTTEPDATYLPVPPSLVLDVPAYGDAPATRYAFGSYNAIGGQALAGLRSYFAELAVRVSEEPAGAAEAVAEKSLSMAEWVFGDYFLLLARQTVQAARDGLRLFKYPIAAGDTPLGIVRWVNENRAVPPADGAGEGPLPAVPAYTVPDLFAANGAHPLRPGRAIAIGVTCTPGDDDTFASLARRYEDEVSAADIAGAGAAAPGLLRPGARIVLPGGREHTVQDGDTLIGVAAALGVRYADLVTGAGLLDQEGLLAPGADLLIPLVTCASGAGETFAALAGRDVYGGAFTAADLAACNAGRAVLRPGAGVPFPDRTPYTVRPGDVLGDVAAGLGVSLAELLADGGVLRQEGLLAPMATLAVPLFRHVTADAGAAQTLDSVAARFGVGAALLGEQPANAEIADLFAARDADGRAEPYLDVPHLGRFRLGELIAEAQRTFAFRQISALTSRYCLHGMRLPAAGTVEPKARGMWVRERDGGLRLPAHAGLHALTGQQVPLPALSGEPFRVFLDRSGGPGWLRFAGADPDRLELALVPGTAEADRVARLRDAYGKGARLDIGLESLGAGSMCETAPATYPCTRSVPWRSPVPVPLPYGPGGEGAADAGAAGLRLYRLPADLTALPDRSVRACDPRMRVRLGRHDDSTGGTAVSGVAAHGWATAVNVQVKLVPEVEGSPSTRSTYEIAGVDDRDIVLLERLLERWGEDPDAAAVDRLILAFPAADGDTGLANDTLPSVTMGLAQTDLSTRTRPPGAVPAPQAAADDGPRLLNDPHEFIRLLWEAGITRGGGFFLYYDAAAEGRGLPERLFAGGDTATVTLVVLYAAPADPVERNRVGAYMNSLATPAGLPRDATVFAEADPPEPPARVPAAPDTRMGALAAAHYGDVADLVAANTGVPLAADARITVDEGVYQAPPGGIALADVAGRFGTTVEALRAANPGWPGGLPDRLAFPQAIRLPRLVLTPGTSPFSGTFGEIIAGYGQGAASLAAANRDVPGPFETGREITVPGGPRTRTATVPPGVAAVAARRVVPEDAPGAGDGGADAFLKAAFTMLGYRVAGNAAFEESPIGLPAGPATGPADPADHDKIRAPRELEPGRDLWEYRQAVPYTRFAKPRGDGAEAAPYQAIGDILQVSFDWCDVYGNTLVTDLTDPVAGSGGPFDQPPVLIGYTDALVGLGQWPSVSSSWQVRDAGDGGPLLELLLSFDDSRYQGLLAAAAPDATTVELTFTLDLDPDGVGDTGNYVFDDTGEPVTVESAVLGDDGRTVRLTVSPLTDGRMYRLAVRGLRRAAGGEAVEGRAGFAYPADGAARTSGVAAGAAADAAVYRRLRDQLADPNGIACAVRTTLLGRDADDPSATGDAELTAEQLRALRAWLCDGDGSILAFLDDRARFRTDVPPPAASHPIGFPLDRDAVNPAEIFPLRAEFRLARTGGAVLGDLATAPGVRETSTPVAPFQERLPDQDGAPTGPLALAEFARRLEAALRTGEQTPKVAVGVDRHAPASGGLDGGTTVWAVRAGTAPGAPISYRVSEGGPVVFAPRPMSTALQSRSRVPIRDYVTGEGLKPEPSRWEDFAEVDVDGWCRSLFGAVDSLLAPRFTAAAQIVGRLTGEDLLGRALAVKERLARAASAWMIPVFAGESADPGHVRELFRQRLLTRLADAYSVRAAVQFEADVHAGARDGDAGRPPELYGEAVQRTAPAGDGGAGTPVSLTSPRLPLRTGPDVPLAFLVSAPDTVRRDGAVVSWVDLDVRYDANAIEHQIGPVPGIADYRASSWLGFVDRDPSWPLSADLGEFPVPLILRAYPESPTMRGQDAAYPGGHDPLDRVTGWDYRFTYAMSFHYPQDKVIADVAFNVGDHRSAAEERADAFAALAEFATVHPAVARDLDDYLAPVDASTGDGEEVRNAAAALRAFLTLAETVADSGLAAAARPRAVAGRTTCRFEITERPAEIGGTPGVLLVTVKGAPPAGGGRPAVDIAGYERHEHGTGEEGRHAYYYSRDGEYLMAGEGQEIPGRTLVLPGLHLLEQQDALAAVTVERNREPIPGRTADERFVYRTPAIRSAAPLQPGVDVTDAIPVQYIGSADPDRPVHRTLSAHLEAVFAALLDRTTEPEPAVQVEVVYDYTVNPDLRPVTLPVLMQAPLAAGRKDGGLTRMLDGWARAVDAWFRERTPVCGGALRFDLTLMTNLTARPMPLLRLRDLRLPIEYVIDPKPSCRAESGEAAHG